MPVSFLLRFRFHSASTERSYHLLVALRLLFVDDLLDALLLCLREEVLLFHVQIHHFLQL